MNINNPTTFSAPNLTLTTSNSSGTSGALRADDSILVYDTTAVDSIAFGQSQSVGSAATASRRDHSHGMATAAFQTAATQAEMEAASSTTVPVTPGRTQFHPAVCKAYGFTTNFGSVHTGSYGVTSFAKVTTGIGTWTWAVSFDDLNYSVAMGGINDPGFVEEDDTSGKTEDTMVVHCWTADGSVALTDIVHAVAAFGKQE